jgi:hypothetical protein
MGWSFGQDSLPSDKRLFRFPRLTADENYSFFPSIALISDACIRPVAACRDPRDAEGFCRFLFGKTAEVAELHEFRLEWIDHGESFQRLIQGQQLVWFRLDNRPGFV